MPSDFKAGSRETLHDSDVRPLFCEMLELRPGQSVWRETARWVKFEEDVEEHGNRWSKPFVASLSLHALMELRNGLSNSSLLLEMETGSLVEMWNILVNSWVQTGQIPGSFHEALVATLLQPYRHQHQQRLKKKSVDTLETHDSEPNKRFLKKLTSGSEAAAILCAELEFIRRPLYGFIKMREAIPFRNLTEVKVPVRYVFVALTPKTQGNKVRELGRTMGTLFSDELFQHAVFRAANREDLLAAVDDFMGSSTVLPPGEWNPEIRIEPPTQIPTTEARQLEKRLRQGYDEEQAEILHESHGADIRRTGRFCGGIIDDCKRKAKFYVADFRDAFHIQSIASIIFLYFASMTPLVTFGGLMSTLLKGRMGAMETILGRAISGVFWSFTAGQPMVILGSTGPILVFEVIIFNLCEQWGIEYLGFRVWIGIWSGVILLFMVAFDSSYLVGYITRFTEESFAALVSAIFVYEAIKKCLHIAEERPIRTNPAINPDNSHLCDCLTPENDTIPFSDNFTRLNCSAWNGTLTGPGCKTPVYVPDAFLLSLCLFFGTFIMSRLLKGLRTSGYFPTRVRSIISDFAVIISIATFVLIDYSLGLPTPKLWVPNEFKPTLPEREEWIVPFFGQNPWWTSLAAFVPGLLATILIFMDQQITTVIVSRKENKLKHGIGYHLDLFVVAILTAVLSMIGMPWMIADTVLSLTHSSSLRKESEVAAPGEKPTFLGIRENRVTNLIISILIGVSVFLSKFLQLIPMPVLFGVFLFMGSNALLGLQFTDRMLLVFMPLKYQPNYIYLRHVQISRVHLFTLIQLLCLATLWVLKSFQQTAMLFPVMVGALVAVRMLLDKVFKQEELKYLDDLMPETTRRKLEEPDVNEIEYFKPDHTGMVRIPLPNGNALTIPVGTISRRTSIVPFSKSVEKTTIWRKLSTDLLDETTQKNGGLASAQWSKRDPEPAETKHLLKD
ncbi:hypothetical protein RvY_12687-2 [Ramazzottius varieornatus]|uniref:Anion exchange protein n=1 Tax=Ramazzottius varieornatus TaxID=947166 RepID=A0A1D1VMM1_RAMVA|nr:hypothetical protein RvY_12687-2 [Ramazzottius varieornatus]